MPARTTTASGRVAMVAPRGRIWVSRLPSPCTRSPLTPPLRTPSTQAQTAAASGEQMMVGGAGSQLACPAAGSCRCRWIPPGRSTRARVPPEHRSLATAASRGRPLMPALSARANWSQDGGPTDPALRGPMASTAPHSQGGGSVQRNSRILVYTLAGQIGAQVPDSVSVRTAHVMVNYVGAWRPPFAIQVPCPADFIPTNTACWTESVSRPRNRPTNRIR